MITKYDSDKMTKINAKSWVAWDHNEGDKLWTTRFVDQNHTPYTKVPGTAVSTMIVEVEIHVDAKWIHIHTDEITTDKNDRQKSKVHSVTVPEEFGRKLYEQLKVIYG